jgi:amidophosphoribosyltransferase
MASNMNLEEMRKHIGVDSLAFISMDGLYRAVGETKRNTVPQYCDACFTGNYPIPLTDHQEQAAPNLLTLLKEPLD